MNTKTQEANRALWNSILLEISNVQNKYPSLSREKFLVMARTILDKRGGSEESWQQLYEYLKEGSSIWKMNNARVRQLWRFTKKNSVVVSNPVPTPPPAPKARLDQPDLFEEMPSQTRHFPNKSTIITQMKAHEENFGVSQAHALSTSMDAHRLSGPLKNRIIGKVQTKIKKDEKEAERKKNHIPRGKKGELKRLGDAIVPLIRKKREDSIQSLEDEFMEKFKQRE